MLVEVWLSKRSYVNKKHIDGEVVEWPEGVQIDSISGDEVICIAKEDIASASSTDEYDLYSLTSGATVKITYEDDDD